MLMVLVSVLSQRLILYRLLSFQWGHAGCPLLGVERRLLLGGSKCTISSGGMGYVRCTEVVRLSESPLAIRNFTVTPF